MGGKSVGVDVGVEVGQGVMVGGMVGVEVGWVGVGVLAARMIIFWFTKIVDLIVRPFRVEDIRQRNIVSHAERTERFTRLDNVHDGAICIGCIWDNRGLQLDCRGAGGV